APRASASAAAAPVIGVRRMGRWYRQPRPLPQPPLQHVPDPRTHVPVIPARRALALLLLALSTLLLTACGSSSDKTPTDAAGILKDTFGAGKPVKSGKLNLAVALDTTGLTGVTGPVKLTLTGPFQSQGGSELPAFDFDVALATGDTNLTAGAVSTGKAGFLKFQGTAFALPEAIFTQFKKGYEASSKQAGKKAGGPSLRTLGVDPLRWLTAPRKIGTETVGGAEANHVSATVDVPKLLTDVDTLLKKAGTLGGQAAAGVPNGLSAARRAQIEQGITSTTFDVWAGKDDGTLRKLDVKVGFTIPASARSRAGGLQKGVVDLTLTIADLNKDQQIDAPKSTRPLSELQAAAAELLGGLATGGGTTATPSTGTSSAPPATAPAAPSSATGSAPTTRYGQCLAAAGADVAKITDCAKLQGQ
ncbi:MAG: hypothetical protein JWM31_1165, partial [Solirubrobacterales bacterium]|nr:hypothetical protein [Solirubrobacterales bacterium]